MEKELLESNGLYRSFFAQVQRIYWFAAGYKSRSTMSIRNIYSPLLSETPTFNSIELIPLNTTVNT